MRPQTGWPEQGTCTSLCASRSMLQCSPAFPLYPKSPWPCWRGVARCRFDEECRAQVQENLTKRGIHVHASCTPTK